MTFPHWRWIFGLWVCLFLGTATVLAAEPTGKPSRPTVTDTDNAWVILASGGCEGCEWLKDTWFPTLLSQ